MLTALFRVRYISILAVLAALFGSLLMLGVTVVEVVEAYRVFLGLREAHMVGGRNLETYVDLLSALDSALFGLVLLYIAYGIYFVFADPERAHETANRIGLAEWLKVKDLGQMKKTVLEVIVVLLAVLFLKLGLQTQAEPSWSILIVPAGIVAIAVALRLIKFDH